MKKLYFTTLSITGLISFLLFTPVLARISNPPASINTSSFATASQLSTYMPLAGGVGTGTWDLGGATFEIPNGATPTVNVLGQVAWDTASASLKLYDGTNTLQLATKNHCFSIPFKSPTKTDEFGHIVFNDPATLTSVSVVSSQSSNAVGWNLKYGNGPAAETTAVFAANKSASGSAVTRYSSLTNTAISENQTLSLVITSGSATVEELSVGVCYRN